MKKKICIVGVSGYVSEKLIHLISKHKHVDEISLVSSSMAGKKLFDVYPSMRDYFSDNIRIDEIDFKKINSHDLVFLCVPHNESSKLVDKITTKIIDLSRDYRLTKTYGLPEIYKEEIRNSELVANPGCYATACILAVYPIRHLVSEVIFHGISGYSGAGRMASQKFDYENNIIAYKLTDHHHVAEIKKVLDLDISFVPHVVDVFSGIMITAILYLKEAIDIPTIKKQYTEFYRNSFTEPVSQIPSVKEVVNTPLCKVYVHDEQQINKLIVVSVIDNLMKGSASQAIENMNLMFGFPTNTALSDY
ncbi:MAG: N-acetyl-gamma-glutamyl-phosphate reductase [Candidatus Micrarchaeota archaeon]|nr:N-acetyl-gamma-glutamyl-phosphate reductase [Candidatus Micrarchaeota archaeon]